MAQTCEVMTIVGGSKVYNVDFEASWHKMSREKLENVIAR